MRKIIFIMIVCFSFAHNSFSQNNYNWITPNKTYLKLFINEDGIYRISRTDFVNAGINTGTINPRTVKVLYKGEEIPIFFQGEDDGVFDASDYFDFYGVRNYGGPTKHRDANTNAVLYTTNEYYNLYSDTSSYWVGWEGSNGSRMQRSAYVSPLNFPDNNYYKKVHFEKDVFYNLGETINPNSDYRYFSNEIVNGEGWFWRFLTTNESLEDTTFINDLSSTASLCSLKVFIKPVSFTNQIPQDEHRIEILINNTVIDTLFRNDLARIDTTITFSSSFLTQGATNSIKFHYIPVGNEYFYPGIFIDFFDLYYQRDFKIRNNNLQINLSGADTTSKKVTLENYTSSNPIFIYDIKNNIKIENGTGVSNTYTFTGKSNSSFRVLNEEITKKPVRILSRQVRDLVNVNNAADYLIVYNKLFESQSEQLKNHRTGFDNFRVFKAEIEDIYDVFNYGMEDPIAVRYFVKYVYESWKLPKLKYVCMFGRASLDPKQSSSASTYYHNFVPTFGNPPTDGYFVNFNLGTFTYYHQISIGRIPAYTVAEAQDAVTKIINYDNNPPDKWWKTYIAITGGGTRAEQQAFQNKSEALINNYIKPPPVSMNISRIYRNDSTGYITYNYKDSIKKEIDRGSQIINFIGHAAAQDWEIGLENPNTLNNGNKQPLVLSFTCFTGKNSEPNLRSFGEDWFLLPNKCAIGFVGTTGWSFSGVGDSYNDNMLRNFSRDSVRRIGDLISYASKRLSSDSGSFASRNTINCYNLIGDPASSLLLPRTPEFDIKQNDYSLSNPFPSLGEQVKLSAYPKNLGTYVDTVTLRFQLRKNGILVDRKDTLIRTFGYLDTVNHYFTIDSIGNYTMTIRIDPNRTFAQKYYNNDSVTFQLTLRNLSFVPVKPLDNSALSSGSFKFTGLNPNVNPQKNSVRVILQVDTSISFSSPVLQTYTSNSISGISTNFNVNIPLQVLNTLYFMRTNAVVNNDSSGWSEITRVIYNPDVTVNSDKLSDSTYTIFTMKPGQFQETDLVNVDYTSGGFTLNKSNGTLFSKSYGSNGNQASYFLINEISYYSDGGGNTGYNFAKLRKYNGLIMDIKNFRMNSPQSSDSVLNFLNTYDTTEYIMGYYASYVPAMDSMRQDVKNKLKEFGSIYSDSLRILFGEDNFDTWSFIGYLGAEPGQTCELFNRYLSNFTQTPLECELTPAFQNMSGRVSQIVGTADKWKSFSWEQTLFPNSSIKYDVFGIDKDNVYNILYSDLTSNSFNSLDTVNSYLFPNLRLDAKFEIDSLLGLNSPAFISNNIKYNPPAELLPDNNSFIGTDTVVQEGDSVRFSINYYNVGFIDAPVQINTWYSNIDGKVKIFASDTVNTPLEIDSFANSVVRFSTAGLRNSKVQADTITLFFETSLAGNKNEIFSYNNTALTKFVVQGDTVQPLMNITYDGIAINNGDFIQANPKIQLQFLDDSRMVINDTNNIKVYSYENNRYNYVPYYINGVKNPVIDISFPDNNFLQATVLYQPSLQPGDHRFRYVATDISGNFADSILNYVTVDNKLRINDIANYPNPMQTQTNFMFMLSGQSNPSSCKVRIYTVAGRLIKEINATANIGYNSIGWNGTDDDGDYIANGVYLYKFVIQGDSQTETATQKLVVLR